MNPEELLSDLRHARAELVAALAGVPKLPGTPAGRYTAGLIGKAQALADLIGRLDDHMCAGAVPPGDWAPTGAIRGRHARRPGGTPWEDTARQMADPGTWQVTSHG